MTDRSIYDYSFLGEVSYWFETTDEVFVIVRYANSGGARDYLFASSFDRILDLASILPPATELVVMKQKQLPYRGPADPQLFNSVITSIPDGTPWLLLSRRREGEQDYTPIEGRTHQELRAAFEGLRGKYVAVGAAPSLIDVDSEEVQSGLVPFPDGSVQKAEAY